MSRAEARKRSLAAMSEARDAGRRTGVGSKGRETADAQDGLGLKARSGVDAERAHSRVRAHTRTHIRIHTLFYHRALRDVLIGHDPPAAVLLTNASARALITPTNVCTSSGCASVAADAPRRSWSMTLRTRQ